MKFTKIFFGLLLLPIIVYILGPKAKFDPVNGYIPKLSISLEEVKDYLDGKESLIKDLRPGNGYQLDFFDGIEKTEYVLLYLHGFSASPVEGAPLHNDFAKRYGMNFYAPLLADHGRNTKESFFDLEPQDLVADAAEALAIAKLLGEKIIVMSCSTGSTLSTYLEAKNEGFIDAQIMYSPNFEIADSRSKLLTKPWGLQIARMVMGSDYRSFELNEKAMPYWTTEYRIEGAITLRSLIDQTMTPDIWAKVKAPYLLAYYFENEELHDEVISIDAIKEFNDLTNTSDELKLVKPMASPKAHVINSDLQSSGFEEVKNETYKFAEDYLKLVPIQELTLEKVD